MRNQADADVDPEHARERPASGCSQIATVWLIGFVGISALYYVANLVAEVSSSAAMFLAALACLALVFYGGFSQASKLTLRYVWIAWGVAAVPASVILSYAAVMTGAGHNASDAAIWLLLVFPGLGALVTSSGVRFRQTRSLLKNSAIFQQSGVKGDEFCDAVSK